MVMKIHNNFRVAVSINILSATKGRKTATRSNQTRFGRWETKRSMDRTAVGSSLREKECLRRTDNGSRRQRTRWGGFVVSNSFVNINLIKLHRRPWSRSIHPLCAKSKEKGKRTVHLLEGMPTKLFSLFRVHSNVKWAREKTGANTVSFTFKGHKV